jgi:hypothetical protein
MGLLYLNTKQDTAKGFLFGLQIPFLPDFLLDHTLLGKEPSDRIQEYSRRWTEFVSSLWRNQEDVTYALRFDLNETDKRIDSYVLGRLSSPESPSGENQALVLLTDLERMLESFGFEPMLLTKTQLQALSSNFNYPYCFEVCQEEVKTPIRLDTPISGDPKNSVTEAEFSIPKQFIERGQGKQIYGIRP